jgi:DNA (cytosine-5)-methyltransferase 1
MGYHRSGFDVVGVDNRPMPRYPFEFHQADALAFLEAHGHEYDVIHASPPCQRYCRGTHNRENHPDLLPITRTRLEENFKPWIIENVIGSPMRGDIRICGCMVGLPLIRRVRLFESSMPIFNLLRTCHHDGPVITVTGTGVPSGTIASWGRLISFQEMKDAMGIDWMTRKELSQAIPPAYTEYIGRRIMEAIK